MAKKFNDVLMEFTEGGGMDAAGGVLGDVMGLIGSDSKYKGGQTGRAVGGGIGTGLGALIGMPGVGKAVGSLIGGAIGGASDKERMIDDYEDVHKKKYSKLNLAANVNPYGGDNSLYMAEGGMVVDFVDPAIGGGGGKKKPVRTYKSQAEVDAANATAQRIAAKRGHLDAANVQIKGGVGDPIIPFVNEHGMDITGAIDLFGTKPLATKIPQGVQIQSQQGQYWYEDEHTGDVIDVDPSVVQMKQFQKTPEEVAADKVQRKLSTAKLVASYKDGGIHIKKENRGKFTAWAKKNGMSVQEAASKVMANKDNYSSTIVKRANFAKNFGGRKAEGGMSDVQEVPRSMVNIEKGELLIDPVSLKVLREYENPNRYKAHNKSPMFEPVGNFTMINEGEVVIPKKYSERFKNGDELTRQSIVAEILKNQRNEGTQYTGAVPMAADGMIMDKRPPRVTGSSRQLLDMWNAYDPATANLPGGDDFTFDSPADTFGRTFFNKDTPATYDMTGDFGNASPADILDPANISNGWQTNDRTVAGLPGAGINKNLLSAKIMGAIPTAFGITNAMGIDPFLRYDENTQTDSAKAYLQDMETSPNIEASKAAIRRTNAGRNQILNNFNSPGTRAEVAANNVAGLKAEGELIQNASNVAMDARNRKRQTLASLEESQGASRLNMRQQLMNELRADKANRENLVHQGLSEAATNYSAGVMDQERIRALNSMATFYNLSPYAANLLADQGEYMGRVMDMMGGLEGPVPGSNTGTKAKTTDVASTTRDRVGNVKQTKQTKIVKR